MRAAALPGADPGPLRPVRLGGRSDRRSDLFVGPGDSGRPADTVRGFPGSAGVVEGVVRVLTDAADGDQLRPGRCW